MPRAPRKRQYGFGSVQRRGKRWRAQWRVGGRRRSKGFSSRELAERFLRKAAGAAELAGAGLPADPKSVETLTELATPWLAGRTRTHRAARQDYYRWHTHMEAILGSLRPGEVDSGVLRRLILDRLAHGLGPSTVGLLLRTLSTFYSDLIDDGHAVRNPVKDLPRKTRRLVRPTHDSRTTPFIEDQRDIGRIYLALPEPANVAYALGALAGLRTGECLALRWPQVDLERRYMQVRESVRGPTKSGRSRMVPIMDALAPILSAWRRRTQDLAGLVVPSLRAGFDHMSAQSLGKVFAKAAKPLRLTFYQATRHTFASHWVLAGGSLEQLREILGHRSITTTERYAHLRPELFGPGTHGRLAPIGTGLAPPAQMIGLRGKVKDTDFPRETSD